MLQDLHKLGEKLKQDYLNRDYNQDRKLPNTFKQLVTEVDGSSIAYTDYSFVIMIKLSGQSIYFPNQLWYIAACFTEFYIELSKYANIAKNALSDKEIKDAKSNKESAIECVEKMNLSNEDKVLMTNFLSDYDWWYGGKTIDRADYYISPILSLCKLVNASQSYIAEMCKFLAKNQNALNLLHGEISTSELSHKNTSQKESLQQIFYGAPGTGKSHKVNMEIQNTPNALVLRTTFHPDSDYSTFVGAYKPTMKHVKSHVKLNMSLDDLAKELNTLYNDESLGNIGGLQKFCFDYHMYLDGEYMSVNHGELVKRAKIAESYKFEIPKYLKFYKLFPKQDDSKIVYSFVPQAFLKAYVAAWQNPEQPVFLVIEEINRGNCAQIFGDIFQLLDRKDGVSEYPIKADQDIQDFLAKEFADVEGLETLIQSGEEMKLPSNLHIWATMNTSDQSLFPIDSAFKRRWDWKYVPIQDGRKKWGIKVNGLEYDWWSFLEKINELIDTTTSSEDKKLGYYFCKPDEGDNITAERFVNKVIFYLWNDVFKDYDMAREAFKLDGKRLAFGKFFKMDGNANEQMVLQFLDKLEVSVKNLNDDEEEDASLTPDEKKNKDNELAEKCKEFWSLFNNSYLHKRGFNNAMGYVRGITIEDNTYLLELPRNSKSQDTNTIKLLAQFDRKSLEKQDLPTGDDNVKWIQRTTKDKDRIEVRLTDVNFDNLIAKANSDLWDRLSQQLDNLHTFLTEKGLKNNK